MVVYKIQRWSPSTCDCVVEQVVGYDEQSNCVEHPSFLLMNEICNKHQHLASTEFKPNHADLSNNVLNLIEQAKTRNLKQVDDLIAVEESRPFKRRKILRDLKISRQQVIQHNNDITEEWQDLTAPPHAHDSHIHDQILKENG